MWREFWIKLSSFPLAEPLLWWWDWLSGIAFYCFSAAPGSSSFDLMTEQVPQVRPPGRRGGDRAPWRSERSNKVSHITQFILNIERSTWEEGEAFAESKLKKINQWVISDIQQVKFVIWSSTGVVISSSSQLLVCFWPQSIKRKSTELFLFGEGSASRQGSWTFDLQLR